MVRSAAADDLMAAQRLWAAVNSPWAAGVDRGAFTASLEPLRRLDPPVVLSSQLPAARSAMPRLLEMLAGAPDVQPFEGPDQAALEAMLAEMAPLPEQRAASSDAVVTQAGS